MLNWSPELYKTIELVFVQIGGLEPDLQNLENWDISGEFFFSRPSCFQNGMGKI